MNIASRLPDPGEQSKETILVLYIPSLKPQMIVGIVRF